MNVVTDDKTLDRLCKSFNRQCIIDHDSVVTMLYQFNITSTFLKSSNVNMYSYVDHISLESHFRTLEERYQRDKLNSKYSDLHGIINSFMNSSLDIYARLAIAYYIDEHVIQNI